ncbi:MAG: DNA-processing protein DprA [Actinomycetota bacterium]|nr:DNA-processing protein DprA [Actinomycetota bacterium]
MVEIRERIGRIATMTSQPDQGAFAFEFSTSTPSARNLPSFDVSLLALSGVEDLERRSIKALIRFFNGDLGKVWDNSLEDVRVALSSADVPATALAAKITANPDALVAQGASKAAELARRRVRVLAPSDIPVQLRGIPDAPSWLFVQGEVNVLAERPVVAVIGTRRPSQAGLRAARLIAKMIAAYPITLVSGLAEGIDEEAHSASLREGVRNVAFLGHGINRVFPASTKPVRERIVKQGGAVVSEYSPDERSRKSYFVERNRLQAGLADMVIPVEATSRSGTAHTVRFAREYGRRVVGIRWRNSNGILDKLERDKVPLVDIFTPHGRKKLDKMLRDLADEHGRTTFALSLVERRLLSEAESREVRSEDVDRLRRTLEKIVDKR